MAGFSVVLMMLFFLIIAVCIVLGALVGLSLCVTFSILYSVSKKRQRPKKWQKIVAIVTGAIGGVCITPILALVIYALVNSLAI